MRISDWSSDVCSSDLGRTSASMAALVEEARWRTSASGKRYLLATCSDESGQFIASIFDDDAQEAVEAAARDGECALLSVELLWRPEEDPPRVTYRGMSLLDSLFRRTQIGRLTCGERGCQALLVPVGAVTL